MPKCVYPLIRFRNLTEISWNDHITEKNNEASRPCREEKTGDTTEEFSDFLVEALFSPKEERLEGFQFSEKNEKPDLKVLDAEKEEECKSEFSEEEPIAFESRSNSNVLRYFNFDNEAYLKQRDRYLDIKEQISILMLQGRNEAEIDKMFQKMKVLNDEIFEIGSPEFELRNNYPYFQDDLMKSQKIFFLQEVFLNKILVTHKRINLKSYLDVLKDINSTAPSLSLAEIMKEFQNSEEGKTPKVYERFFLVFPFVPENYIFSITARLFTNRLYSKALANLCCYPVYRLSVFNFIKLFLCLKNYDEDQVELFLKEMNDVYFLGLNLDKNQRTISDVLGMFLINLIYFISVLAEKNLPAEFSVEKLAWPGRDKLPPFLKHVSSSSCFESKPITEIILDFLLEFAPRKFYEKNNASLPERAKFLRKIFFYINTELSQGRSVPESIMKKGLSLLVKTKLIENVYFELDLIKFIPPKYYCYLIKETLRVGFSLYLEFFSGQILSTIANLEIDKVFNDEFEIRNFMKNLLVCFKRKAEKIDESPLAFMRNMDEFFKNLVKYENIKQCLIFCSRKSKESESQIQRDFYSDLIEGLDKEFIDFKQVLTTELKISKALITKIRDLVLKENSLVEKNKATFKEVLEIPCIVLGIALKLSSFRIKFSKFVGEEPSLNSLNINRAVSLTIAKQKSMEAKKLPLLAKYSSIINQSDVDYKQILQQDDLLSNVNFGSFLDYIDIIVNYGSDLLLFFLENTDLKENLASFDSIRTIFNSAPIKQKLKPQLLLAYLRMRVKFDLKNAFGLQELYYESISITANRKCLFEDVAIQVFSHTVEKFSYYSIEVIFKNEMGIDAGGLSREMFSLISKEICDPRNGLFRVSENKTNLMPNPFSGCVPDHLLIFELLGILISKSILENRPMNMEFSRPFLKRICGEKVSINDLEDIDSDLAKNLIWLIENDIGDGADLDTRFNHHTQFLGLQKCHELKEGGSNIVVNQENKFEYVELLCKFLMIDQIEPQTESLKKGLKSGLLPRNYKMLEWHKLGLFLSGNTVINIESMRKYCHYIGFTEKCREIQWFWEILEEFDSSQKSDFVFFVSGAFKPPLDGFKNNPIKIENISGENRFPNAHTCSFAIELSKYSDKEILREKLTLAILEGFEGFHNY